ncbi:MAG: hypothetical protein HY558_02660 [Euryarchaeota archaeon]|nr:hypothetical protein [Euryarchaeota archaeon]
MGFTQVLLFGAIFAIMGGLIYGGAAQATGRILGLVAIVAGALGGLGVGLGAKRDNFKNPMAVKLLGVVFGLFAILSGYFFFYLFSGLSGIIPFDVFMQIMFSTGTFEYRGRTMPGTLSGIDILFFGIGLYGGYRAAEYFVKKGTTPRFRMT